MRLLGDALHTVSEVASGCGWWERLAVGLVKFDCFLHDLTELCEDLALIVPVTTAQYQAGSATDVAIVFV
jgi:hypothetical protein